MSIVRCTECERTIDLDDTEQYLLDDLDVCERCYEKAMEDGEYLNVRVEDGI